MEMSCRRMPRACPEWNFAAAVGFGLSVIVSALGISPAWAEGATIVTHAVTTFGEPPKYPADFQHLDYVNPDAPKGGEMSISAPGSFDKIGRASCRERV